MFQHVQYIEHTIENMHTGRFSIFAQYVIQNFENLEFLAPLPLDWAGQPWAGLTGLARLAIFSICFQYFESIEFLALLPFDPSRCIAAAM